MIDHLTVTWCDEAIRPYLTTDKIGDREMKEVGK